MKHITIRGAHIHNLKGFDIAIPKNKLIVATGVSGSGKSSLVFDIIFEEGRRQYLRSLGILSGFDEQDKFDSISGIGPAIAVQQSIIRQSNPRSTVGSRTQILNLLGLLFAAEGQIYCTDCGIPVNEQLTCNQCGYTEERLGANYFSYNHPNGMCTKCSGRGGYYEINLKKLVPVEHTTLQQVFDSLGITPGYQRLLNRHFSDHLETPFSKLPDEVKHEVIYGHYVESNAAKRSYCLTRIFQDRIRKFGEDPSGIYAWVECSECHGFRIGDEARSVRLKGRHIGELGKLTIAELQDILEALDQHQRLSAFGENLLNEILHKTINLNQSRLGHLSLYREMPTLSGGEIQRLFLHSHLDSQMDSLIYVLDEPTVGLHESEKAELRSTIQALKEIGNTVIVVEHDGKTIEAAEHIIDLGPKAGIAGGQVVYQGDFAGLLQCEQSITGQYLGGNASMPVRNKLSFQSDGPYLIVRHAQANNLKDVTASFPLGCLVGVAGVSGSGKSSLISETLIPLLKSHFGGHSDGGKLGGVDLISGFAEVSQAPIGRNMNSTPVSYLGIWDKIRKLFARQPEALERNLSAGHFSFNSKGACPECGGSGRQKNRLGGNFKIYTTCLECKGKRYSEDALSIHYQGKSIFDVLALSISQAIAFLGEHPGILSALEVMERIGMGYVKLGQPTPTLSGGEAQRVKLAKEIGRRRKGNILYVLDEPTTGLSLYDTAQLILLLDELVAKGNSVIVIEHDPAVLSACDWIIELGPGGGAAGGQIIAQGSPEELKANPYSVTGPYLK